MKGKGRSPGALAALVRGGAGKHGDRRTKRLRTRGARLRAELKEQ